MQNQRKLDLIERSLDHRVRIEPVCLIEIRLRRRLDGEKVFSPGREAFRRKSSKNETVESFDCWRQYILTESTKLRV